MLILPNCCLPEGIMVDILSRLPVKSLLRFRSVCKQWYVLLTSPDFITMQLHQTSGDKLLTESDLLLNYNWYIVPALYVCNRDGKTSFDLPLHLFPFSSSNCVKIVGTCNGLICAQGIINRNLALVIWNPATRQFRYLDPHPDILLPSCLFVGFGFLVDTNDYKVVVFRSSYKLALGRIMVFVYTFSSDSWRVMEVVAPVSRFHSRVITLNGVFYWIECVSNKMEIIVSFDLHDEVFGQMTVPDSCGFDDETKSELVVLKGSLSVIFYSKKEERNRCFEIWVMTEHGLEESWTRLFTIGPFLGIVEPVGSWKNGELIFRYPKSSSNVLFSYDLCTLEIEYFAVPEARGLIRAFNYVESLEFVNGGNKRSSTRSTMTREYARIQMACKNLGDLETPSNDFVWEFAIPGPKNSGLLHCRLCGELFYHGNITGLNIHLAHRNTRGPPCPYVSSDIGEQMRIHLQVLNENLLKRQQLAHRKSRASPCACVSVDIFMGKIRKQFRVCVFADIFMGKMRKQFRVLKEKLMIKKRGQREKVAVHIRLPPPQHEDDEFYDDEFYDDEFDDFD